MSFLGRSAVILKGTTEIGACIDVSISIDVDLIKQYFIGSDKPGVLEAGNKKFSVSIKSAYVDDSNANDVLAGNKVTIEVRPEGSGSGKPKITLSNVVFTSWEMSIAQDGIILENVKGEGTDIAFGTQT